MPFTDSEENVPQVVVSTCDYFTETACSHFGFMQYSYETWIIFTLYIHSMYLLKELYSQAKFKET